jgi:cobalt/nickel transport system permease protein
LKNRDTVKAAFMHIPDNFLSTPVWAALDGISIPAVALLARRATRQTDEAQIPLLGIMGAFVFAAQMINFPVGPGTSGHLVGGTLLACTLGAAPASIVMMAILATQALIFQDGGVLALGANVFNMAIAGVFAGYLPFKLWGGTRARKAAIFGGAVLSVVVSAGLALSELLLSGVRIPRPVLLVSALLFLMSGLLEGAITATVVQGIEKLNTAWVQTPAASNRALVALGGAAALLVAVGFLIASTQPDGILRLGSQLGIVSNPVFHAPLADYAAPFLQSTWLQKAAAGLMGLLLIYGLCVIFGRVIARRRSA